MRRPVVWRIFLQWHDFKRYAEDLRDFLAKLPVLPNGIARSPKPSSDDLLAKQLRT